ncbi:phosphotransferase [Roseospira goensis]|uniref:Aminoglycoside phosphotransferase (APT) family kinase protein n=1 Tax=Roseospira goensis TaxID=391922 RepID=A0A7W6WJB1_9PROT|nr:phosphotransferase [Roseospira goensis]MBB4284398.1 aminoglycoside phosphotransferase (APT) family kinase protein [Roseospira goensis]
MTQPRTPKPDLRALLAAAWPRLGERLGWAPERVERVAVVTVGHRNPTLDVTHAGVRYAVRLPRPVLQAPDWYRREAHNVAIAAAAGVTPPPLVLDPADGLMVLPWIEGRPAERGLTPAAAARAGAALRRLHDGGAFEAGDDALGRLDRRLPRLRRDGAAVLAHARGLPALAEAVRPILEGLSATRPPPRPCHGDLVLGNMVDTGRDMVLLDWETATMGDPLFDLATVCVRARLEGPARAALLDTWFGLVGDPDGLGAVRVRLWEVVYCLDKAVTYWANGRGAATPDRRCAGWTARGWSLLAAPGTRAAAVRLEHQAAGIVAARAG